MQTGFGPPVRMNDSSIHVLLVEDNPTDALIVREELAHAPDVRFAMMHVSTARAAVAKLKESRCDVVLLDLGLPDSDGLQAFETLHRIAPKVPILILSGRADEDLAIRAVHAGAEDYLVKGRADESGLARAIRYAIERSRAKAALQESDARFHQVVENIHEALWMFEVETQSVVYVSPRFAEIWG